MRVVDCTVALTPETLGAATSASEVRGERVVCEVCRNVARFCKLSRCPFYRDLLRELEVERQLSRETVYGPTPPFVLVGERGYPNVYSGPLVSLHPEVSLTEDPRAWLTRSVEELLRARLTLAFFRVRVDVRKAERPGRLEEVREAAASVKPVEVEVRHSGAVTYRPGFGLRAMPHGPSLRMVDAKTVGNPSIPKSVDELIEERVRAEAAVRELSRRGFDVYYITRLLSSGLLGSASRRMVPTEWSITAVDDMLGRDAIRRVRRLPPIDEFRVYRHEALHNRAIVLLTPTVWMFELLEGWLRYPEESPYADHELHFGRTEYAENTGGAYYAVRLSVARHLERIGRQAGSIVFFEVGKGWIPLGVWRFREITAAALEGRYERFGDLREALDHIAPFLEIPMGRYLSKSALIRHLTRQGSLL
ncbi:MAG: hypothetical protein QXP81_04180 [Nitrososphaerota archaeon]